MYAYAKLQQDIAMRNYDWSHQIAITNQEWAECDADNHAVNTSAGNLRGAIAALGNAEANLAATHAPPKSVWQQALGIAKYAAGGAAAIICGATESDALCTGGVALAGGVTVGSDIANHCSVGQDLADFLIGTFAASFSVVTGLAAAAFEDLALGQAAATGWRIYSAAVGGAPGAVSAVSAC